MACFVLCQLQQWVDNREGGQEFRAQAIPSPLGVPRTGNRMSSEGGGFLGRKDAPPCLAPGGRDSLFVLSGFFFKKHKHMAADGAGAVFGWCICLPFAWLSVFFTGFSTQLVHRAVRLVSEALLQHPEISTSFPVVVLEFPVGKGLENFLETQA